MENFFLQIIHNEPLMAAAIGWGISALLKFIIIAITSGELDWESLLGPGGMPSTHTTPVVACTTSIGLVAGFDQPIFALGVVMTIVVAYDAAGIRRHAGEQAQAINNLIRDLAKTAPFKGQSMTDFFKRWNVNELKTLLGHNPMEVVVGVVLGILTAILVHYGF